MPYFFVKRRYSEVEEMKVHSFNSSSTLAYLPESKSSATYSMRKSLIYSLKLFTCELTEQAGELVSRNIEFAHERLAGESVVEEEFLINDFLL